MRLQDVTSHIDPELLDVQPGTNIYTLLNAFLKTADCVNKAVLVEQLTEAVDDMQFFQLDRVFGALLAFQRIDLELYTSMSAEQLASLTDCDLEITNDQWEEIMLKDAAYRERIKAYLKAIQLGGTVDGIKWAYRAATGKECDVLENFRYRSLIVGRAQLAQALTIGATTVFVNDDVSLFPNSNGTIEIDGEQIHYTTKTVPNPSILKPYTFPHPILASADQPRFTGCTRGYNATVAAAHPVGMYAIERDPAKDQQLGVRDPNGGTEFTIRPHNELTSWEIALIHDIVDRIKPEYTAYTIGDSIQVHSQVTVKSIDSSSDHYEVNTKKSVFDRRSEYLSDILYGNAQASTEWHPKIDSWQEWLATYKPLTDKVWYIDRKYSWYRDSTAYYYGKSTYNADHLSEDNPIRSLNPKLGKNIRGSYWNDSDIPAGLRIDPRGIGSRNHVGHWESRGHDNVNSDYAFEWMELRKPTFEDPDDGSDDEYWFDQLTHLEVSLPAFAASGQVRCYISVKDDHGGWQGNSIVGENRYPGDTYDHTADWNNDTKIPYVAAVNLSAGTTIINLHQAIGPDTNLAARDFRDAELVRLTFTNFKHKVNNNGGTWGIKINYIQPILETSQIFPLARLDRRYKTGNKTTTRTSAVDPDTQPEYVRWFVHHEDHMDDFVQLDLGELKTVSAVAANLLANYKKGDNAATRAAKMPTEMRAEAYIGGVWTEVVAWTNWAALPKMPISFAGRYVEFGDVTARYVRFYFRNVIRHAGYRIAATFIQSLRVFKKIETPDLSVPSPYPVGKAFDNDLNSAWCSEVAHNKDTPQFLDITYPSPVQFNVVEAVTVATGHVVTVEAADASGNLVPYGSFSMFQTTDRLELNSLVTTNHVRISFTNNQQFNWGNPADEDNFVELDENDFAVAVREMRIYAHTVTRDDWIALEPYQDLRKWEAPNAIDDNKNTFWESTGVPSKDAVEWLIMDVSDLSNNAQRVDMVEIDPIWAGCQFNVYASTDDPPVVQVLGERAAAGNDILNEFALTHRHIVGGSVAVFSEDRTIQYGNGLDFTVNYNTGLITRVLTGAITAQQRLSIDYSWMDKNAMRWMKLNTWWDISLQRSLYRFKPALAKWLKLEFFSLTGRPVSDFALPIGRDFNTFPEKLLDDIRSKTVAIFDSLFKQLDDFTWKSPEATAAESGNTAEYWKYQINQFPQQAFNWLNSNLISVQSQNQMEVFWQQFETNAAGFRSLLAQRKNYDLNAKDDYELWKQFIQGLPRMEVSFPALSQHAYQENNILTPQNKLYFVAVRELKVYRVDYVSRVDVPIIVEDFLDMSGLDDSLTDDGLTIENGALVVTPWTTIVK